MSMNHTLHSQCLNDMGVEVLRRGKLFVVILDVLREVPLVARWSTVVLRLGLVEWMRHGAYAMGKRWINA